jgi:hypothetical protein
MMGFDPTAQINAEGRSISAMPVQDHVHGFEQNDQVIPQ